MLAVLAASSDAPQCSPGADASACAVLKQSAPPALLGEVARAGDEPREAFETALMDWAADMGDHLGGDEDKALGVIAACVGAMTISRAMRHEESAMRVLEAGRRFVESSLARDTGEGSQERRSS